MKKITLMLFMSLVSLCGFAQFPEGFEGTFPPPGWGIYDNGIGTNYSWTQANGGPLPAHTGDHAAYMREENVLTGLAEDWLTTPLVEVPADPQVVFWSRMTQNNNQGATFEVRLSTDPDQSNLAGYTEILGTWTETELNPIQTAYNQIVVPIPATFVGQDVFIAFVRIGDEGDRWLIDDVNVISECFAPTNLAASNFGLTTATLSWGNPSGATSFEIEIMENSALPTGTATHTHNGAPSFDVTGLTEDTDYKYYVRAMCADGGISDWVGPFNFSTVATGATCQAPILITTANYSTTDNTSGYGDDYNGSPGATGCGTTGTFLNGNDVVYAYTASATGVVSISMTNNGANSGMFVYNTCADIGVSCVAGGTGNATTPVNIPAFNVTSGTTYYIVISTSGTTASTPYTLTIQQVFCAPPVGNAAENVDADSADLSWSNPSGATSWEVAVQTAGSGLPATGTTVNTDPEFTATGLLEATNYEYYVRAACGDGNFSQWAGPYLFTTTQVPATMDYSQDFEGVTHGWSLSNGTQTNKWHVGAAIGNGGQSLYVSNDNGVTNTYTFNTTSVVHAYRDIQMPAAVDQVSLSYDWKHVGESCCDWLRVWLVPATYNPTPGTEIPAGTGRILLGQHNQSSSWTSENEIIDASDYAGQIVRVVFEWDNDGSVGTNPPAAVDNINLSVVTCPAPTDFVLAGLTEDDVTFTWNGPTSVSPTFDYYISESATAPVEVTPVDGNTAAETLTLSDLEPATTYYVWVRSNCGPGDVSFWTGPVSFNTAQIPALLDYSEGFEDDGHGWVLNNGTQTNKWHVGTATSNGGTQSLYISNDNGVSNTYVHTLSVVQAYKDIQMPASVDEVLLSYDWKAQGESCCDYLRVWVVPVTFTPTAGTQTTVGNSGGVQFGGNMNLTPNWTTVNTVIDASPYAGQIVRLMFEWRNDGSVGTPPPAAIDNINISVITCPAPSDIVASNITQTEATIDWTGPTSVSPTYDYYLSDENIAPGDTDVTGNVPGATVDLDGLEDSTMYYFWVRSNCGPGDTSFWIGPYTFNTDCGSYDIPYYEGFNTNSESEFCWTVINANADTDAWDMNYATNPFEGNQVAVLYTDFNNGANDDWLISPTINLTGNQRLRYHYRVQSAFEPSDFEVLVSTTGIDPADFTIEIVPLATYSNTTYVEVIVNLMDGATPITGPVNIAWHVPPGGPDGWRTYIDNVIVENIPTCPDPTDLSVANVTQSSAELSWTPGFTEDQWQVVVQPQGTGVPTADVEPTSDNDPYLATGLEPSTQYEYYVRAHCADDDLSNWVGPFNFSTTQIPADLNFVEDFEGDINWTFSNGTQTNQWFVGTAVSNSPDHSLYISNDNGVSNAFNTGATSVVHAYRDLQMPAVLGEATLTFDWKAQGESCCDYLRVWLVPSSYVPVPGTLITEANSGGIQFGENNNMTGTWTTETYTFQASDYAGQVMRLVFEWRNDGSIGTQPPAAVDNVNFVPLTCPSPVGLITEGGIGNGDVTLVWTPIGTETQWEVVVQEAGTGTPGATPTTSVIVDEPSYSLEIEEGIFYEYYVRAICSPDDIGLWSGPASFSIFNPPGCADVEVYDINLEVVAPETEIVLCEADDNCVELSASYFETGETTSYEVEPIDYDVPFPFSGGTELDVTSDDIWSPVVDLPFDFCFFGETYDEAKVGSNGVVMFGDNMTDGGNCDYSFSSQIPTTNADFSIRNAIYGVYQDIDPSVEGSEVSINYQVLGTYPCRALVVNFYEVPQFLCDLDVGTQTSQIVIYEISNIIEVYVEKRTPCDDWQDGVGVIGIMNEAGTQAYTPPGRNTGNWTALQEAWRFTPNGESNVVFEWLRDGEFYSNETDISVCVDDVDVMTARATYTDCNGDDIVQESEVTIRVAEPIEVEDPLDLTACSTGNSVTFDLTDSLTEIYNTLNPEDYTFLFYDSEAAATEGGTDNLPEEYTTDTSQTIYVRVFENGAEDCFVVLSFELILSNNPPVFTLTDDFSLCEGTSGTITVTPGSFDVNDVTFTWTHDGDPMPDTGSSIVVSEGGIYEVTVNDEGCEASDSVTVTIVPVPVADEVDDVTACGNYTLQPLSAGNSYFTGTGGTGTQLSAGEVITSTQTIFVFAQSNTTPNCTDESSFVVTVVPGPVVTTPGDVNACDSYTLPALTVGNYFTEAGGNGTMLNVGDVITETQLIYVYAESGTEPNCTSEDSFTVTVSPTPVADQPADVVICDIYTLPALSAGNNYFTEPGGQGTMLAAGSPVVDTQTVYVFTTNGTCSDENSFTVTIVPTPIIEGISEGCEGNQYVLGVVFSEDEEFYTEDNVDYEWTSETGVVLGTGATLVVESPGTYHVKVTPKGSDLGCYVEGSIVVTETSCLIPRGISPNGDEYNQSFDLSALDVRQLSIFNRYGTEVYSFSGAYTNQWEGQASGGDELPTGTYFYMIERANGESKTGWVYINREE